MEKGEKREIRKEIEKVKMEEGLATRRCEHGKGMNMERG